MRKRAFLFVFVLLVFISGCGVEGRGSDYYYTEIYFKNGLEKNIVLKAYVVKETVQSSYLKKIAYNETIEILRYYYPIRIEVYEE